jgi:hypothetical protein
MDKALTDEFWQTLGALISRHPPVIILLLVVFGLGWIIKGWVDGREIRGLKAENRGLEADKNAADTRLKLAQEEQKVVTAQLGILEPNSKKLETEFAALKVEVAQMKAVLPQLDRVATTTAMVTSTARALSEANTVLGSTLSSPAFCNSSLNTVSAFCNYWHGSANVRPGLIWLHSYQENYSTPPGRLLHHHSLGAGRGSKMGPHQIREGPLAQVRPRHEDDDSHAERQEQHQAKVELCSLPSLLSSVHLTKSQELPRGRAAQDRACGSWHCQLN